MVKVASSFLSLLFYMWLFGNFINLRVINANDAHDAEVKLRNDLLKNYTADVIPPHNYTSPITVNINMIIISLKDLDAKTQTLTTEAWLWMNWNDSRLAWNPKEYSGVKKVRFWRHKIWQPDIQIYNSAKMSEMDVKTETFTVVRSTGHVTWLPPVTLYSICVVDNKYYPYDTHACKYKFGSWTHAGDHIDLEIDNDTITDMDLSMAWNEAGEWDIIKTFMRKTSVKYDCCNESYPDVTFSVLLQRRSPFYQVAVVCPLVAASFFLLASFWLSPATDQRIILNVVSFLTAIVLLMHLSSSLPAVGKYCPLIMTFCGALLIISALTTSISIAFITIAASKKNDEIPEWMRNILQSPNMKFFCITVATYEEVLTNQEDSVNLVVEDGHKATIQEERSKPNQWTMFFQLIDRVLFVVCLISIFATMIAASQTPDIANQVWDI